MTQLPFKNQNSVNERNMCVKKLLGQGRRLSPRKRGWSLPSVYFGGLKKTTLGEYEGCDNSSGFSSKSQDFLGYNISVIYLLESLGRKLCRCLFGFCLVAWNYENCPACFATIDKVASGFSFLILSQALCILGFSGSFHQRLFMGSWFSWF